MSQGTVETFARGLIDRIVFEAFDKIKIRFKKGHKDNLYDRFVTRR